MTSIKSLLVVCVGNVCRSPIFEKVLIDKLGETNIRVFSAGLSPMVNAPMHEYSKKYLLSLGVKDVEHSSKMLVKKDVVKSDLILVMESTHKQDILSVFPYARGKVFLISHLLDGDDTQDPLKLTYDDYHDVADRIVSCADAWYKKLFATKN